jgi:uncharacterized protein DUF5679
VIEETVKLFSSGQEKKLISDQYPKSIGFSLPAKMFDYEFLICGKNVPYTQNQIIGVFIENGAMLLALDSSISAPENKFILSICCNLEDADLGPVELAVRLQTMKFVISAEYCEIDGRLFGRRMAGITFNNKHPAVSLHSGTLINLGRRLAQETGSTGTSALYQEGREYAHQVARELGQFLNNDQALEHSIYYYGQGEIPDQNIEEAYCMKCRTMRKIQNPRQVILSNRTHALQGICAVCTTKVFKIGAKTYGKLRGGPLIENVQAFLMSAGWGMFELRSAMEGRFGAVTISDPPTLEGDLAFGNQFVEGIAAGLLEAASSNWNKMVLVGEKYDQNSRTLSLHFAEEIPTKIRAKRRAPKGGKKESVIGSGPIEEARGTKIAPTVSEGVKEIDRIIRSLEKIESDSKSHIGEQEQQPKEAGQLIAEPVPARNASG